MRFSLGSARNPARIKNIVHGVQGFLIFLGWALTTAVFTKAGGIDGRSAYYWALCWFTIPALVYLVGVPMWPRARRFGNVYAFATIDGLYAVLWFAAWASVASYVSEGKSLGHKKDSKHSGCDAFAYGSPSKCSVSEATVFFGVIICLLFVLTSFFSFRNVIHFRRTGTLPDTVADPTFAAQTNAAFSSNPVHDFDEEEEDFRSGRPGNAGTYRGDRDEDYALLQQCEIDDLSQAHGRSAMHGAYDPTAPAPGGVLHDYHTAYGGAHGQHYGAGGSEYGSNSGGYRP